MLTLARARFLMARDWIQLIDTWKRPEPERAGLEGAQFFVDVYIN